MGEIEKIRAALEPFALSIRDHVPDSRLITTVAWTAGQHRAVCEALDLLEAMAKRIAELEAEAVEAVPGREAAIRALRDLVADLDQMEPETLEVFMLEPGVKILQQWLNQPPHPADKPAMPGREEIARAIHATDIGPVSDEPWRQHLKQADAILALMGK